MRLVLMVCVAALVGYAAGHGRLEDPPSRATAWRYGFKTPPNYQDNELFCGGFPNQQSQGGKCGVCGDPYQGPRPHEAGGKYATGTIVKRYNQDSKMAVRVQLTANHKGWMEFRLCPVNDPKTRATPECLDRNLLTVAGTQETRFKVTSDMRVINVELDLPEGLTCTQCVLQWKYNAGNSWGTDPITSKGCVGCGPQEQFYGCSDIAINPTKGGRPRKTTPQHPTQPTRKLTTPQHPTQPTRRLTTPQHPTQPRMTTMPPAWKTTAPPKPTLPPKNKSPPSGWCKYECCTVGVWRTVEKMDEWCMNNCSRGFCPASHCKCLN